MMSGLVQSITGILCAITMFLFPFAVTASPTAAEIIHKSNEVGGGDDSISRLSFTIERPGKEPRKLVYSMVWKDYGGRGGVDDKVIFFNEYPPDDKGKSFMIWMYKHKKDDAWMYLPELRMVRKITHEEHHGHSDEEDDFSHSVLTRMDLMPRDPDLDDHTLLQNQELNGHRDYVVESVPKKVNPNYPYQKVRRWITQDNFLPERIDYFGVSGTPIKRQTIEWQKVDNLWVWRRVVGENLVTNERTELDISDIKLNSGLTDEVFSARTLRLGKDSIMQ